MRRLIAPTAITGSLVVGLLGFFPGSQALASPQSHHLTTTSVAASAVAGKPKSPSAKKPPPTPDHYTPTKGVRFNNPLGGASSRRRIISQLIRTIDSVPSRQQIRIASWNIRSNAITDALVRAHLRGVSVRIVMDRFNANPRNPNPNIKRLAAVLKTHNKNRKPDMKSRLRECVSSCRYYGGIAHTKFFLFSKAGKAKNVVMYGSANATDLAAFAQWNDLYTLYGDHAIDLYNEFDSIFDEMIKDKPVTQPYQEFTSGRYTAYFYPDKGPTQTSDPVLDELNRVQCSGATNGTGINGHTSIRIAQDAMYAARGLAIAQRLAGLKKQGCNIKIVYSVFGNNVLKVLRGAHIPTHQIASDGNFDGLYDRYLHMKNMAISGNYDGVSDNNVVWNGSANWTSVALASDEIVMRIYSKHLAKQYSDWVDYLYTHQPRGAGLGHGGHGAADRISALTRHQLEKQAEERGIDPYALIKQDL